MGSNQSKLLTTFFRHGLILFVLTSLASAADAQPKLPPSEQYPGPWLEVTQEIREVLAHHKVSACNQAVGRKSSFNFGEYLLYCTRDEKLWTSWHVEPAKHEVRGPGGLLKGISLPDRY